LLYGTIHRQVNQGRCRKLSSPTRACDSWLIERALASVCNNHSYNMLLKSEDRGKFLTSMLVLDFLGIIYTIQQQVIRSDVLESLYSVPPWYKLWLIVYTLSCVAINVGIWKWKRIAVYLFFFLKTLQLLLISTIVKPFYYPQALMSVGFVASNLPWAWAIKRKWHLFF
jgi:hypothetical protein